MESERSMEDIMKEATYDYCDKSDMFYYFVDKEQIII